jgi:hypothetical protein
MAGPTTWCANGAGHRRWAEAGAAVHVSRQKTKIPACPEEDWLSDGQRVLHFKPVAWDRWRQELEVTSGQVLPDAAPPLLQGRARLSREQAIVLWRDRIAEGWRPCSPQWGPPRPLQRQ